jgi:FKBP-type peptidyl-prolyl cis-trans isomerase
MSTEIDLATELAVVKAQLNDTFDSLRDILADEHKSPVISIPTPLEIQMAAQLKEQTQQMAEMASMMKSMMSLAMPLLEEQARKLRKEKEAEASRKKAVEELERKSKIKAEAARRKEERQENAKKRSAARIQAGEFNIWNRYGRDGFQALITGKGQHVWESDRTPITVDGKVCVGPRLGYYMGVKTESIPCGGGVIDGRISQSRYTLVNGVTYDGSVEPRLY